MRLYNVVHILVGTPGRVLDLADKGIANLKECNTLIMDEASPNMALTHFWPGGQRRSRLSPPPERGHAHDEVVGITCDWCGSSSMVATESTSLAEGIACFNQKLS